MDGLDDQSDNSSSTPDLSELAPDDGVEHLCPLYEGPESDPTLVTIALTGIHNTDFEITCPVCFNPLGFLDSCRQDLNRAIQQQMDADNRQRSATITTLNAAFKAICRGHVITEIEEMKFEVLGLITTSDPDDCSDCERCFETCDSHYWGWRPSTCCHEELFSAPPLDLRLIHGPNGAFRPGPRMSCVSCVTSGRLKELLQQRGISQHVTKLRVQIRGQPEEIITDGQKADHQLHVYLQAHLKQGLQAWRQRSCDRIRASIKRGDALPKGDGVLEVEITPIVNAAGDRLDCS
jgi:hypothetical protein